MLNKTMKPLQAILTKTNINESGLSKTVISQQHFFTKLCAYAESLCAQFISESALSDRCPIAVVPLENIFFK